ncbi:MAG: proline hydroxylase [Alphaproteobacteria bacterium]|nr:MAG: proline hydroxylase [Alphaproteobacteria bacterium]
MNSDPIAMEIEQNGFCRIPNLLAPAECDALTDAFGREAGYRRHIVMQNHGYGRGEYKYFSYPLPDLVAKLRAEFYEKLAPLANRWGEALGMDCRYPARLSDYTETCHAVGQCKPTPLILKYGEGDYNRLHQDLYGEYLFPMQMVVLLSRPGEDFEGGELILTEQRARQQSRVRVVPLKQGDAAIIAVNDRPIPGKARSVRVKMRHGVSDVRRGNRFTLGIIFHDAR